MSKHKSEPQHEYLHQEGIGRCAFGIPVIYITGNFPGALVGIDQFLQANPDIEEIEWRCGDTQHIIQRKSING